MPNYLEAFPGIRQKINNKIYTIIRMYSKKQDAERFINKLRKTNTYKEVILFPRIKEGKLYGAHPFCVDVRGKVK
jgi:hypothetical protein